VAFGNKLPLYIITKEYLLIILLIITIYVKDSGKEREEYAVYRTLPVLKSGTVFAGCLKYHFSISFSEEMVGLVDFLFVGRSFLDVQQ